LFSYYLFSGIGNLRCYSVSHNLALSQVFMSFNESATAATPAKEKNIAKDSLAFLRRSIEKMKSLQATERVLASVEKAVLNKVPEKFNLIPLSSAIHHLNEAIRLNDEVKIREANSGVSFALESIVNHLVQRDDHIQPYNMRRFCDQSDTILDLNAYAALTSFYRSLPHTEQNRGKYDFVVTRLFSTTIPGSNNKLRTLRTSREQVVKRLTEMCAAWGEDTQNWSSDSAKVTETNQCFDNFINEVRMITSLEEMADSSFFQRVRDFKANVGELLYLPEVTATSVETNIIIANRFTVLMEAETEEIREEPEAVQEIAAVYSDIYSGGSSDITRIINELEDNSQQQGVVVRERVSRFTRLLQIAVKSEEGNKLAPPPLPDEAFLIAVGAGEMDSIPEPSFATTPAAEEEMSPDLQMLCSNSELKPLVESFMKSSAEVRKLDIHNFLSPLPEESDLDNEVELRRESLELILSADYLVRTELGKDCEPADDIEDRVDRLFSQMERSSDEVRDLIKEARNKDQNANYEALLQVYNHLMGARLRMQSAIVRRTASELSQSQEEEIPQKISSHTYQESIPVAVPKESLASRLGVNKWLVTAAILLIALALAFKFLYLDKAEVPKDGASVVLLNRSELPGSELISQAKLNGDLLLCEVNGAWAALPPDAKKEKLEALYEFAQTKGASILMVVNSKGTTVGSANKSGAFTE
jgi:hypothetical protein